MCRPIDENPDRRTLEAVTLTIATLIVIWCARGIWLLAASICLTLVAVFILWKHAENSQTLGIGLKEFKSALIAWKWWFLGLAVVSLALGVWRMFSIHVLLHAGSYLVWCCFQQFLYQNVIYKGIRAKLGSTKTSQLLAGLVFSSFHLPNPVLVPATLFWGTVSSRLFERQSSIFALGLLQMLLSDLLHRSTPFSWHHGFKVGPYYFLQSFV